MKKFILGFNAFCSVGICLNKNGKDENENMFNFPGNHTKNECIALCNYERHRLESKVTGCEHKHGIECHYHTKPLTKGNGRKGSVCCVYESGEEL